MGSGVDLYSVVKAHWARTMEGVVMTIVASGKPVAIVGKPGTGKTLLSWGALTSGLHVKLREYDQAQLAGIPDELENGALNAIFDDISAIDPGSPGAEAIREQCHANKGFIAIFDDEADIEKFIPAGVSIHVVDMDEHTQRSQP